MHSYRKHWRSLSTFSALGLTNLCTIGLNNSVAVSGSAGMCSLNQAKDRAPAGGKIPQKDRAVHMKWQFSCGNSIDLS